MKPGTVIAGRFEVVSSGKFEPTVARDRDTGGRVHVVSIPEHFFLDRAAVEEQDRIVRSLADPVLVPPLHLDPLVLPAASDEPELDEGALVDAAIDLVAAIGRAWRAGVAVNAWTAWLDKAGRLRLPAPSAQSGLHVDAYDSERMFMAGSVRYWLQQRLDGCAWVYELSVDPDVFAGDLAAHARDPEAARRQVEALEPWPVYADIALDFDRGLALGEARLREGLGHFELQYANMPLAAADHHRGCVRWRDGRAEEARADVARACELDPHTRYLTTAALISGGDPGTLLDAAVAAIEPASEPDGYGIESIRTEVDEIQVANRDAARSLHARAAHRAKTGDRAGALADLEQSLARAPTEAARALLDRLEVTG